jgi:purine nucleoside phosphorylase
VPEALVAHHCGMKVAALSVVTNLAAGMTLENLTHEGTLEGAHLGEEKVFNLVTQTITAYAAE